jgi:hypothetical protein
MDDTPAPRRRGRRAAVLAIVAALVTIPAIAIAGTGGDGGSPARESAPALQERSVKDHDGRDCPFKKNRERRSSDAGV